MASAGGNREILGDKCNSRAASSSPRRYRRPRPLPSSPRLYRRPRAGGDPSSTRFDSASKTWVPAYAGTTFTRSQGAGRVDNPAAQANFAVIQHGRLARRDRPLRLVETQRRSGPVAFRRHACTARRPAGSASWRTSCAVAGGSPATQLAWPAPSSLRQQPRMVVALHDVQRVAGHVLARDEPRRRSLPPRSCAPSRRRCRCPCAGPACRTLRPTCSPTVRPSVVLDRARLVRQVAVQEFAERALADEADAGRILLRRVRQADLVGDARAPRSWASRRAGTASSTTAPGSAGAGSSSGPWSDRGP